MQSGDSKKEEEEYGLSSPGGVRWKSHSLPRSVGCNMMSILPKRDIFPSLPFTESAETAVARRKLINKTFLICSLPSRIPIPIFPFPGSRTRIAPVRPLRAFK